MKKVFRFEIWLRCENASSYNLGAWGIREENLVIFLASSPASILLDDSIQQCLCGISYHPCMESDNLMMVHCLGKTSRRCTSHKCVVSAVARRPLDRLSSLDHENAQLGISVVTFPELVWYDLLSCSAATSDLHARSEINRLQNGTCRFRGWQWTQTVSLTVGQ